MSKVKSKYLWVRKVVRDLGKEMEGSWWTLLWTFISSGCLEFRARDRCAHSPGTYDLVINEQSQGMGYQQLADSTKSRAKQLADSAADFADISALN